MGVSGHHKEKTGATSGNLSVKIEKLREAGYIDVVKSFKGKMTRTTCRVTDTGILAFEKNVAVMQEYIGKK